MPSAADILHRSCIAVCPAILAVIHPSLLFSFNFNIFAMALHIHEKKGDIFASLFAALIYILGPPILKSSPRFSIFASLRHSLYNLNRKLSFSSLVLPCCLSLCSPLSTSPLAILVVKSIFNPPVLTRSLKRKRTMLVCFRCDRTSYYRRIEQGMLQSI